MADYRNSTAKYENKGLDIVHPPDLVPEGKWTRLTNTRTLQEGFLQTRNGIAAYVVGTGSGFVGMLRRIDPSTLIIQSGDSLYRNNTLIASGFSGRPVSAVRYRPELTTDPWLYIADTNKMVKVKSDGTVYQWGITPPSLPCTFAIGAGTGDLNSAIAGASLYDYRQTWYSSVTGAESNPSPVSVSITAVNQNVDVGVFASPDPQVTNIRVWRRGGTITSSWKLVATLVNVNATYNDSAADSTLLRAQNLSTSNDVPFTVTDSSGTTLYAVPLRKVWGPFIGRYVFACGDPNRPGYAYWTNAGNPDGASALNNIQVSPPQEPLLNGFVFGSNPYAWTRDNLYTFDFGGPTALPEFKPRLIPLGIGLATENGFTANGPMGVFFLSKDGIYVTDCQTSLESLTHDSLRPIFVGKAVGEFQPVDFHQEDSIFLEYCGQELHFVYKDLNGNTQWLYYDLPFKRWTSLTSTALTINIPYGDENHPNYRLLIGTANGNVFETNTGTQDLGLDISGNARSRSDDFEIPNTFKEFGSAILDVNTNGNDLEVTPFFNAESIAGPATTINTPTRQLVQIPLNDTYALNVCLDFSWTGQVDLFQATYLWRDDEEAVIHWEHPETSHGLPGWMHIRDGYIGMRSTADVTMVVYIDGVANTYTLPSTGGERRKIYVKFNPAKGKMFRYTFDSSAVFRLYGEDTQLNIKPWNTQLGYKPIYPFPSQGYAPFLRTAAGT